MSKQTHLDLSPEHSKTPSQVKTFEALEKEFDKLVADLQRVKLRVSALVKGQNSDAEEEENPVI